MKEFDPVRYHTYRSVADVAQPVAKHLGIRFSPQAVEVQRCAMGVVGLVDGLWDDGGSDTRSTFLEYADRWAEGDTADPPDYFQQQLTEDLLLLRSQITTEQAQEFVRLGRETVKLAAEYQTLTDLKKYARLRRNEAMLTCYMMTTVVPLEEQKHPMFPFYAALSANMAGVGGVLDSAADLPKDYPNNVGVPDSIGNHFRLWWLANKEGLRCAKNMSLWLNAVLCVNATAFAVKIYKVYRQQKAASPKVDPSWQMPA